MSPSENLISRLEFNLPTDLNKDGKADMTYEQPLSQGFSLKPLFYTADDGGMVFACPNEGAKTSKNTSYPRTELEGNVASKHESKRGY